LEHLSDASFLSKLLVFPANVRLDWKVIATYKHSSLFSLINRVKEKSFITLTTGRGYDPRGRPEVLDHLRPEVH
jgi:hypothetical protein